ncbi:MAG: TolB family protein [Mariniblastus sp.]
MNADGSGKAQRLTKDNVRDHDPYFSPDGKQVAWLTQTAEPSAKAIAGRWGIQIMELDEDSKPRMEIDDGHINSYPAFSPSSEHIYFHRLTYGGKVKGFRIYRIRTGGEGLTPIAAHLKGNQEYPNAYSK